MQIGIVLLCCAYVFSQFFRSFLAVLAPDLAQDVGATVDDLALASGLWFLSFSVMQVPVGAGLDRFGPKLTAAPLFFVGAGGGAAVFAMATAPWHISLAMALIGVGCSPVLMAAYFIFSKAYAPARFATLAAVMIGVGSLGNLAGSYPLTAVSQAIGWRMTLWCLSAASVAIAILTLAYVKNPETPQTQARGSFWDLLKLPALWLIIPLALVNYAPVAGMRGLWIGPYMSDVFGASADQIGQASLVMSLAMILGTFAYGPLDRIFKTRKWIVFIGNSIGLAALLVLWWAADLSFGMATGLFAIVGFFGMTYPLIVAHGKAFAPPHLSGRGVTLMNLFSIGGVGLFQVITGWIHQGASMQGQTGVALYQPVFLFYCIAFALSLIIYAASQDRLD